MNDLNQNITLEENISLQLAEYGWAVQGSYLFLVVDKSGLRVIGDEFFNHDELEVHVINTGDDLA